MHGLDKQVRSGVDVEYLLASAGKHGDEIAGTDRVSVHGVEGADHHIAISNNHRPEGEVTQGSYLSLSFIVGRMWLNCKEIHHIGGLYYGKFIF